MNTFKSSLVISLLLSSFFIFSLAQDDMSIISYGHSHVTKSSHRTDEEVRVIFEKWLVDYRKYYNSLEDKEYKYQVFKENLKYIDYRNSQNLSFKLGLTTFTDLTNEEYQSLHVGGLRTNLKRNILSNSNLNDHDEYFQSNVNIPSSIDWREKGAVTEVKNQGKCESCSIFSAIAATEGIIKITTGNLTSLSEQQIVDCNPKGTGCKPNWIERAYDFIISHGVNTEKSYPYTSFNAIPSNCDANKNKGVFKVDGYRSIAKNEDALKARVAIQPVSGALEASGTDFQHYTTGVFDGNCGTVMNHAITIVGYGTEDGKDYWLIKNSWGKDWGDKGYIKLLRGKGKCAIHTYLLYPVTKNTPNVKEKISVL